MLQEIKDINWYCHGIPERCLVLKGKRMNICARCFGCNIGHIIAILLFIIGRLPKWYFSLILLFIMLLDWSLQTFFKIMSNNTRRAITGIIGGIGIGSLIWGGISVLFFFVKNSF
jgi:uncharacterized membrane protein